MPRAFALAVLAVVSLAPRVTAAQDARDSATVTVRALLADSTPATGVIVRAGRAGAQTDATGAARLRLAAGAHTIALARLGLVADSARITLRAGADTSLTFVLAESSEQLERVVVSATRSERRIEDDPVRVEALDLEEVEEKLLMTPGDITMMLNETSGLRVQTTSPSLGGANVRVQGLRGRYTQILSDGLPLFGAQTGGLGLLQIPPMDLGGVEVIKGAASALYGGTALGGVVNLISRRAEEAPVRELLLNQTTLGGTDVVAFLGGPLARGAAGESGAGGERGAGGKRGAEQGEGDDGVGSDSRWSYTTLAGFHRQRQTDRDDDGWTDLPGYERGVVRPRLFWSSPRGDAAMLTGGATLERRTGGTLGGRVAPGGLPFAERLRTERYDLGGTWRRMAGAAGFLSLRGSFSSQHHAHTFGDVRERDRHLTSFSEAAYTRQDGSRTWVMGAALVQESYRARDVAGFDFTYTTPGLFAQATIDAGDHLAMTLSSRVDRHSEYGTQVSPRASVLWRLVDGWVVRGSAGGGFFAPTPFTEETEVVGLTPLRSGRSLGAERARNASLDIGGTLGAVEVNATVFTSRITDPVGVRDAGTAVRRVELVNLPAPSRSSGGELLARWSAAPFRVTATYTYVRATELDPETFARRVAPLTPRHQAGMVASWEEEGRFRAGLEVYYTGRQALDDNPYRSESKPYWYIGALVERRVGAARLFVNLENLLDVRQTKHEPLVRPAPGLGGRWTNDVWAPLEGRVFNAGVRWGLRGDG